MKGVYRYLPLVAVAALFYMAYPELQYAVEPGEQVVVTQFGKIAGEAVTTPGKYFKIPIVQQVHFLPADTLTAAWQGRFQTRDGTALMLDTRALWRIADPNRFFRSLATTTPGERFISQQVGTAQQAYISTHTFHELTERETGDARLEGVRCTYAAEERFLEDAMEGLSDVGIELEDVEAHLASIGTNGG